MTQEITIQSAKELGEINLSNFTITKNTHISIQMKLIDQIIEKPIVIQQVNAGFEFNLDIKLALFGKSKVNIPIELNVQKGARDSKTYLQGLIYLVGKNSSAYVVPSLYIHEKNINGASHGVVIKNIKDRDLVYFFSRGIEKEEARNILTSFS